MLAATPQAWLEDDTRQKSFEQHKQTQSLVMLFSNTWPDPVVEQKPRLGDHVGRRQRR